MHWYCTSLVVWVATREEEIIMLNLGLGSSKSKTTSQQTDVTKGTETLRAGTFDTQGQLDLLAEILQNFNLDDVMQQSFDFARQQSADAINNIFTQYRETALPQIMAGQTATGAYGSTSAQLMANDAFSRATAQGAELSLGLGSNMVNQQLQNQQMNLNQFAQLLQANIQQFQQRDINSTTKTSGTSTTRGRQTQMGLQLNGEGGGLKFFGG